MREAVSVILYSRKGRDILPEARARILEYIRQENGAWELRTPIAQTADESAFAGSLVTSIRDAKNEIIALWDATTHAPIKEIELLLPVLSEGCDVAVGSRFMKGKSIVQKSGTPVLFWRERFLNWLVRFRHGFRLKDYSSGCMVFKKKWFLSYLEKKHFQGMPAFPSFLQHCVRDGQRLKEVGMMWISCPSI